MKVKSDFITNSSSTSFIVWGIQFDLNTFKERYGESIFASTHIILGPDIVNKSREEFFGDNFFENCNDIISEVGLECAVRQYGYDDVLIGMSPFDIKDHETGGEYKQKIIDAFAEVGIKITKNQLQSIETEWED